MHEDNGAGHQVRKDGTWGGGPFQTGTGDLLAFWLLTGGSILNRRGHSRATKYRQIYIHSKLMIIDDGFFTLGSANMSQRSMAVDSEINVSTDTPAEVTALRRNVWKAHTKRSHEGDSASPQEIAETFRDWQKLMRQNDGNKRAGLPLHGCLCALADYKFSDTRSL